MGKKRLDILFSLLKESPSDLFVLFAVAKELEKEGKWLDAQDKYKEILKFDHTYLGMYFHYVQNLIQNGQFDLAGKILEMGIEEARGQKDQKSLSELIELGSTIPDS